MEPSPARRRGGTPAGPTGPRGQGEQGSQVLPRPELEGLPAAEAIARQAALRHLVRTEPLPLGSVSLVAGCDLAIAGDLLCAAVRLYAFPSLKPAGGAEAVRPARFPYVPGLLSFREVPVLLDAFARLDLRPDVVLCDGQGIAHPRRFGLACHLGLLLDLPSVGCAKSRLTGEHGEVALARGSHTPLRDGDETIGAVLRTRDGVRPLFISIGHRARIEDAIGLVLACGAGYRLPEPVRQADRDAGRLARALSAK